MTELQAWLLTFFFALQIIFLLHLCTKVANFHDHLKEMQPDIFFRHRLASIDLKLSGIESHLDGIERTQEQSK